MTDEAFWEEVLPDGPDYDRAKEYLSTKRVKSKIDDAISASITDSLSSIESEIKSTLVWQDANGKDIDASFIFAMNSDMAEEAVADWLAEHDATYDRKMGEVKVKDTTTRSEVDVKRPGMESEKIKIKGGVRAILTGIREDAALQAKMAGDKTWPSFIRGDADASSRVKEEAANLNSIYTRRNIKILKNEGYATPKLFRYDKVSISHQEVLERHAIKDLNAVGAKFWDGKKMTTWQDAVEKGRISKGVLQQYGFTKPSIEDYFVLERGRIKGFTPEGKVLANKK